MRENDESDTLDSYGPGNLDTGSGASHAHARSRPRLQPGRKTADDPEPSRSRGVRKRKMVEGVRTAARLHGLRGDGEEPLQQRPSGAGLRAGQSLRAPAQPRRRQDMG